MFKFVPGAMRQFLDSGGQSVLQSNPRYVPPGSKSDAARSRGTKLAPPRQKKCRI